MDAAYAAGILDGEGCLTVGITKKTKTCDARVYLGMTAKALAVLRAFHEAFGGTLRESRKETEKWGAAWMWCVTGKAAVPMLKAVTPHLVLKARQAALLVELEETKPTRGEWTEMDKQRGIAIRATVMELNRKGPEPLSPPLPGALCVRDVDGFMMQKRSPDLCDDTRWEPWSGSFSGSGIAERGVFWTLSSSESPSSDDGFLACSLADILEPNAPLKYSLSPKAAAGVLRRAAKRGRELPEPLLRALIQVASMGKTPTPVTLSSPDH